ncbi:unnamed protein product [Brassica oleracea]
MGKNSKKKKEKPILSKEEKNAKKALKKKNQKERVKSKTERKEANRRKRVEEEDAQASPRSTASTSKKKKMKKSNESPTLKIKKAEKKRSKKLKKLEKLREPLILTKEEQDRIDELKSRPIIAWWDFENLSYPWVGVYKMILNKLRREGYTGKLELHAIVGYKGDKEPKQDKTFTMHYGDLNPRPTKGTKGDQKADNHMRKLITDFLEDEEMAPQNTLLITNDNGFREELDLLRAAGHGVLLATMQKSLIIKAGSHKVWFWKHEIVQQD